MARQIFAYILHENGKADDSALELAAAAKKIDPAAPVTAIVTGSGAGLDALIASRREGPTVKEIGVDMNPAMCRKAKTHASDRGTVMECHEGAMEAIPLPDQSVDVVISNGVINLSFRKRKVVEELFRVLKPGGRISITDIVSAKQLSQSIVNDPKLWAS